MAVVFAALEAPLETSFHTGHPVEHDEEESEESDANAFDAINNETGVVKVITEVPGPEHKAAGGGEIAAK